MLYIIAIIGIAFLGMFAGLKLESARVESYKARATSAEQANKALDEACKAQAAQFSATLSGMQAADAKRAAASTALRLAQAKARSAQRPAIDKDIAASKDATALTPEAECAAMRKTVESYAKDAIK